MPWKLQWGQLGHEDGEKKERNLFLPFIASDLAIEIYISEVITSSEWSGHNLEASSSNF